ncbi:MAG: rRNA maturation RNase YbeY [Isosphaeraceae bacterium]|jgi:probable rRNA maturation factor
MSTSASQQPGIPDRTRQGAIVVEISNTQGFLDVDAERLTGLVEGVLRDEGIERAAISVALVDNATIRRLNQKHLAHDWPTDVISFTLSAAGEPELVGELVVSTEMAAATAKEVSAEPAAELALYVVHGLLHLCGYDDLTESDIHEMRARESTHLRRHGLMCTFSLVELARPGVEGQEQATWSG